MPGGFVYPLILLSLVSGAAYLGVQLARGRK